MNDQPDITGSLTFGLLFIAIGTLVLLHELGAITLSWAYIIPVLLIIAGVAVIVSARVDRSHRR